MLFHKFESLFVTTAKNGSTVNFVIYNLILRGRVMNVKSRKRILYDIPLF